MIQSESLGESEANMRFTPSFGRYHSWTRRNEGITAMALPPKFIGMPIKRREDPRLITGTATYVDGLPLPRMPHIAVLRSPYAHAHTVSIDTQAARSDPRMHAGRTHR